MKYILYNLFNRYSNLFKFERRIYKLYINYIKYSLFTSLKKCDFFI